MLATGCTPDRISYGNTIKKESEIAAAFKLGVTLFAVDCEAEVDKVARAAPGARVICRIHCDGTGAEWPLSRKFGCEPEFAADILERAHKAGPRRPWPLVPCRLAAAQRGSLGPRAGLDRGGVPHLRRARHHALHRQSGRRLPGQICAQDAEAGILRQGDLPLAAPPFRQPHPGNDHRARPRHGRQCRRDRGRGGADRQAQPGGRHPLGLSRHRQIPRAGGDDRRIDPLSDPHPPGPRREPGPASWPDRPATRWTCCTRRRPTRCRFRSPSATRC